MGKWFKNYWPSVISSVILLLTVYLVYGQVLRQCGGNFCYPLDDTWIHLAIAKHAALNSVWGVTPYEFSSSSSSVIWTWILLAIMTLLGDNPLIPLILNVLISVRLMFVVQRVLTAYKVNTITIFLTAFSVIYFTPLVTLIFTGMEHIYQALWALWFILSAARVLEGTQDKKQRRWDIIELLYLAPFLIMTRLEGIFLVFIVCILLVIRRHFHIAIFLAFLGILPIVIYGLISTSQGWFFLPNSILLKGRLPEIASFTEFIKYCCHWLIVLTRTLHLLPLVLIGLGCLILRFGRKRPFWDKYHIITILFLLTTVLHLQFARTGWMYRYEAYLVCMGIVVSVICLKAFFSEIRLSMDGRIPVSIMVMVGIFILLIVWPMAIRGGTALRSVPRASKNIYEQQYQMGLFLREYYTGEKVVANDIGAINYLADIRCVDIWGLANLEVAKARMDGSYGTEFVANLAERENAAIAVVYPHITETGESGLPSDWMYAGEWKISDNIICTSDTVQFYAVDPAEWEGLMNNLREFSERLPEDVMESGIYLY